MAPPPRYLANLCRIATDLAADSIICPREEALDNVKEDGIAE